MWPQRIVTEENKTYDGPNGIFYTDSSVRVNIVTVITNSSWENSLHNLWKEYDADKDCGHDDDGNLKVKLQQYFDHSFDHSFNNSRTWLNNWVVLISAMIQALILVRSLRGYSCTGWCPQLIRVLVHVKTHGSSRRQMGW